MPDPTSTPTPTPTPAPTPPTPPAPAPTPAPTPTPAPAPAPAPAPEPTPAAFTDFKMPDGMTLDKGLLDKFTPLAQGMKLNQDQAQQVVDLYAGALKAQQDAWGQTLQGWVDQAKADKEIGGQNLESSVRISNQVLDKFGPNLRSVAEQYGLAHHPEFMRMLVNIGKAMGEDVLVRGGNPPTQEAKTTAQKFYPGMNP